MKYPLVRDLAAEGISKQACFKWLRCPVSTRGWEDAHLTNAAVDAHRDDPQFGYRLIADKLERLGLKASENRIWRLRSDQRIWLNHARKRGLNRRPGPPVHDDLFQRDLAAGDANELWITDITEHPTKEGKLYVCLVQDVFSKRIVGYLIDKQMPAALAVRALENAVALRGRHATVIHSGWQSVPLQRLRQPAQAQRSQGLPGPDRRLRRQRRHGVVQRSATEERPRPAALGDEGRAASDDRPLDRADLQRPAPPARTRQAHTDRI